MIEGDEAPSRSSVLDRRRTWYLVGWGLTVWAAVAVSMRLIGHVLLSSMHTALGATFFVSVVPLMAMVTYPVYRRLDIPPVARPLAAAYLSVPGMILDVALIVGAEVTLPAMDPSGLTNFGAVLLFGYAIVLLTGFVPRDS